MASKPTKLGDRKGPSAEPIWVHPAWRRKIWELRAKGAGKTMRALAEQAFEEKWGPLPETRRVRRAS